MKSLNKVKLHSTSSNTIQHAWLCCSNGSNIVCQTMIDNVWPTCLIHLNGALRKWEIFYQSNWNRLTLCLYCSKRERKIKREWKRRKRAIYQRPSCRSTSKLHRFLHSEDLWCNQQPVIAFSTKFYLPLLMSIHHLE